MFQLTDGQKALVVAICLGLVLLTVVVTVCTVFPSCWLFGFLRKLSKQRKMKYGELDGLNEGTFMSLHGSPQYSGQCCRPSQPSSDCLADNFHVCKNCSRKREDSTYSSMSSSSQGNASVSNYTEPSLDTPLADNDHDLSYGQVTFGACCQPTENSSVWQFVVVLKEAEYLPPRLYGGACDPYIVLHLLREKGRKRWSKSHSYPLYEFRTQTVRRNQHPLYKEVFVMEVTKVDLKQDCLKIAVFDDEKYANDSELGEVVVSLRDIPLSKNGEEVLVTRYFTEPKQELGQILIGLSFLPTSERLTFNIVKASNLQLVTNDVNSFAPFVRVLLLHNEKIVKKKKTCTKPGTVNPVFNELLTFDLPPNQLDHVVFLLVATHRDPADGSVSSPDSPTGPLNSYTKRKRYIGKVVIGSSVRGASLSHWNAMKHSPRKQVTQWHMLR